MPTCEKCGSKFSIWKVPHQVDAYAPILCANCLPSQQQEHAEKTVQAEAEKQLQAEPETILGGSESIPTPSNIIGMLTRRYLDSYTEAHAVVAIGKIIKGVGAVLAVIIFIGGFLMASSSGGGFSGRSTFDGAIAGIGFALACLVGVPIYVLGILVSAQGQVQLATLDTAVNNSRHLQDDDVARILSKKFSL